MLLVLACAASLEARASDAMRVGLKSLLAQPDASIDLLEAVYVIEREMNPALDKAALFREVDGMVAHVRRGWPTAVGPEAQLLVLLEFLYKPGPWNSQRPFRFNFDDPWGETPSTRMVSGLLSSRLGNCVSMPVLVVILGQRLGMEIRLAKAQRHYYARFRKDDGTWINVEATSGGGISDERLIRENEISDVAIRNGVYMQGLDRRATAATMLASLMSFRAAQGRTEDAINVGMLAIGIDPKSVEAMLRMASGYYGLLKRNYFDQYASQHEIPPALQADYERVSYGNTFWGGRAQELGWRDPSPAWQASYLETIKQAQSTK